MTVINKRRVITIRTLGCSKNTVESEVLARQLEANNFEILHDEFRNDETEVVIINTCGFINDAKEQSIETILEFGELKKQKTNRLQKIFVIGCLSERYKDDIRKLLPEADCVFGCFHVKDILESLGADYKSHLLGERVLATPNHYAYLKISEGCDRTCSFCAIPLIKGRHVSKPMESLVDEAKKLADKGVKELILVAQDSTYYGYDLYKKSALAVLMNKLADIKGIEWIRLHYAYPAHFPKDVIKVMKERPNICKYLDIPLQHISDKMLKLMKRNITGGESVKLLEYIRKEIPEITLRTTMLTGHPGETVKEYNELKQFIAEFEFDRLGVFDYSHEEDTYSYQNFKDSIPYKAKIRRRDELMQIQQEISNKKNQEKIGREYKVLIDRMESGQFHGRTEADSPEVDNEVIIETNKKLKTGAFYNLIISDASEFDLFAKF